MRPILNIAIRAVRKAGNAVAKYYEMPNNIETNQKNRINSAINVDKVSKEIIIETIRKSYPQHIIFIEKTGEHEGTDKNIQWIIDPLDGIINFFKRLPHFAVAISIRIKGRTEVTAVYDPMRNELFTAIRGQGAQLNGYRLRGSNVCELYRTVLATRISIKKTQCIDSSYINILGKLFIKCADFRLTGSVVLDFAYVAAGRIDAYLEIGIGPWNCTAGELIVRESGAIVCDFTGGHHYMMTGNIIAGNPRLVKSIMTNLHHEINEETKR